MISLNEVKVGAYRFYLSNGIKSDGVIYFDDESGTLMWVTVNSPGPQKLADTLSDIKEIRPLRKPKKK